MRFGPVSSSTGVAFARDSGPLERVVPFRPPKIVKLRDLVAAAVGHCQENGLPDPGFGVGAGMAPISYRRHRSPPSVIARRVLHLRSKLSRCRGLRRAWPRSLLRKRSIKCSNSDGDRSGPETGPSSTERSAGIDEMVVRIAGKHIIWRAVDTRAGPRDPRPASS